MIHRLGQHGAALVTLGFVLVQLGWLFATPPARGIDEFDHIHRAAAVASGQWVAEPASVAGGTGAELVVEPDIVDATREECQALPYTGRAECVGRETADGIVVAGGAGRYPPLYYAVVGQVTHVFDGAAAVYAMRVTSMLLCAALVFLAFKAASRSSGSPLVTAGMALGLTPVVAYSSIVISPNALEILAGLLLWIAWTGTLRAVRPDHYLLVVGALAGVLLVLLRPLGPLWCLLILTAGLSVVSQPWRRVVELLRERVMLLAVGVVGAATLIGVWWTLTNQALEIRNAAPAQDSPLVRLESIVADFFLWVLQSIGAFPYRGDPAPMPVYACFLILGATWLAVAWRRADAGDKWMLLAIAVPSLLVPGAITYATYSQFVDAWQGRYTMPFSIGVPLLAGYALHRAGVPSWLRRRSVIVSGIVLYVVGHVLGPLAVQGDELLISPGVDNGQWILVPPLLVGLSVALGALTMALGALTRVTATTNSSDETVRVPSGVG